MNKSVSKDKKSRRIYSSLNSISFAILYLVFLIFADNVFSAELILSWDANSEPELAGYKIHYGTSSGNYTNIIDVGNVTSYIIYSAQEDQTYYFAATAYDLSGNESDYSQEISLYIEPEENIDTDSDETADDYEVGNYSALDQDAAGGFDSKEISELQNDMDGIDPALDINSSDIPQLEIGKVNLDRGWMRVNFKQLFSNPVVIAKFQGLEEREFATLKIFNVDSIGFFIFIPEWNDLNEFHMEKIISYLVIESGSYALNDGTSLEAGCFNANATGSFEMITFNREFQQVPVVLTTVTSLNDIETVTTLVRNVSTNGFELCIQHQDGSPPNHPTEIISYLAWEPSTGSLGDFNFEVDKTDKMFNDELQSILYNSEILNNSFVFWDRQATYHEDPTNGGLDNEELESYEKELINEVAGYMLFETTAQFASHLADF